MHLIYSLYFVVVFKLVYVVKQSCSEVHLHNYSNGCVEVDNICLDPADVINYEAIKTLHAQLDDDRSGDIDVSESVEFLKEELQYAKGFEKRQEGFHHNDDHISVKELWFIWKSSAVHNWTIEESVAWLVHHVELPQYSQTFIENAINGSVLPRLAANNEQFLTKILGIKTLQHKSKLAIKAMDAVLFGPPKATAGHVKDLLIGILILLMIIGSMKFYSKTKDYTTQLSKMLKDMDQLRDMEENFKAVGTKLKELGYSNKDEEVRRLEQQLEEEREQRKIMEEEQERYKKAEDSDHLYYAPPLLQLWLQCTFEREQIAFQKKHAEAREQLRQTKELVRSMMEEVTHELAEREQRWKAIESLCGCSIMQNPGLQAIELQLRPRMATRPLSTCSPSIGCLSIRSTSFEDGVEVLPGISASNPVQQLLSSQSALMFLTMGGCSGLASSMTGSPTSLSPVSPTANAPHRGFHLVAARDSSSSYGSEGSESRSGSQGKNGVAANHVALASTNTNHCGSLHHSYTMPLGTLNQKDDIKFIPHNSSFDNFASRRYFLDSDESSGEDITENLGFTKGSSFLEHADGSEHSVETSSQCTSNNFGILQSSVSDANGHSQSSSSPTVRSKKLSTKRIFSKLNRSVKSKINKNA